jgi:hypothetical protein
MSRSQWPLGLRRRSAAAHLLGLWVQIPPRAWMWVLYVFRWRSLRRADHWSISVLPTVVRHCVWSRNLKNVETIAHIGPRHHKKKKAWWWFVETKHVGWQILKCCVWLQYFIWFWLKEIGEYQCHKLLILCQYFGPNNNSNSSHYCYYYYFEWRYPGRFFLYILWVRREISRFMVRETWASISFSKLFNSRLV